MTQKSDEDYTEEVSLKTGISTRNIRLLRDSGYEIIPKDILKMMETSYNINSDLRNMKKDEPSSDNEFFRCCIIGYEHFDMMTEINKSLSGLFRAVVYSNRFKNNEKIMFRDGFKTKDMILGDAKVATAQLLTQLFMICESLEWDWEDVRMVGANNLRERHKDFKRDGWTEVKK